MFDNEPQMPMEKQPSEQPTESAPAKRATQSVNGFIYVAQILLGIVAFGIFGWVITVAGFPSRNAWPTGILLLLWIGLDVFAWRSMHGRGFVIGQLIGLGLVGLAVGLCFAAFMG